jgi:hypothetical protein
VSKIESVKIKTIGLEIPVLCNGTAMTPPAVQARLDPQHRVTLQGIASALIAQGARLQNGKRVLTGSAAVVWIIEQLGKSLPVETPPVPKPASTLDL